MYLELRHLRTIRAIHQAGGLARAADMMNMTQSALSHQVAGLEAQVGMELFVRRSKPMTLSAAGINIEMISTSEIRISIVCRSSDLDKGVKAAHTAFDLDADQIEAVVYGGSGR